jgi:CRISPR-associated exonuclease Cas4
MPDRFITAGELKNWAYCPRVVFYRRTMPFASEPSYKMREAAAAHEWIESLEARRSLTAYGLEGYERIFHLWLTAPEAGVSGKVDLVLVGGAEAIPVDFKLTAGDPGRNHDLQLAAYAVLLEESRGWTVRRGFVYRIPDARLFEISLGGHRSRIAQAVEAIGQMERSECLPLPTEVRRRCEDCEYANFCADVW